jgi:4-hydroxyphenylpyruvate dioxygenase-like putative hemolysin
MAKGVERPMTVFKPKGFDHGASDLVTVRANERGEFVQVFNHRRSGGRVVLSYQRTPTSIESISWTVVLAEESYERVEVDGEQRCLRRRDGTARVERMLPSGRLLIQDPRAGLSIKDVWSAEFNWEKRTPKGGPLNDRAIMKLQDQNLPWYVSLFQVRKGTSGEEQKELLAVEEYVGREYQRTVEFA